MRGIILSVWVQSLRSVLGKQLLQAGILKRHWQEDFFDHLLPKTCHTKAKLFSSRLFEAGCCNRLARRCTCANTATQDRGYNLITTGVLASDGASASAEISAWAWVWE